MGVCFMRSLKRSGYLQIRWTGIMTNCESSRPLVAGTTLSSAVKAVKAFLPLAFSKAARASFWWLAKFEYTGIISSTWPSSRAHTQQALIISNQAHGTTRNKRRWRWRW